MATLIEMPKLSDTMEEGGVASWLIEEGQEIEEGDALLEIETDKATMEYSSPEEGVLLKILVQAGQTVALNAPIAVVGTAGEAFDLDDLIKMAGGAVEPGSAVGSESTSVLASIQEPEKNSDFSESSSKGAVISSSDASSLRVIASPLAKKMARDKGVDLKSIEGSGPLGRIVAKDIKSISRSEQAEGHSSGASIHQAPQQDVLIPLSMMRKTIAKRLLAGKSEAPHFYLTVSANMEKIFSWRKVLNLAAEKDPSIEKVSVNDIIMMATGRALRAHPGVNASWQGDAILQHGGVHICMAVALPSGLVTPVIRNIDRLGVRQIAAEAKAYGRKARDGNLSNEDYQGGTFTISNLGMTGVEEFTAIINPPQAGILAVGRTIAQPWVDDNGDLIVQKRMKMTLSSDHRVIDGMVGAKFLETVVAFLENPLLMLS